MCPVHSSQHNNHRLDFYLSSNYSIVVDWAFGTKISTYFKIMSFMRWKIHKKIFIFFWMSDAGSFLRQFVNHESGAESRVSEIGSVIINLCTFVSNAIIWVPGLFSCLYSPHAMFGNVFPNAPCRGLIFSNWSSTSTCLILHRTSVGIQSIKARVIRTLRRQLSAWIHQLASSISLWWPYH